MGTEDPRNAVQVSAAVGWSGGGLGACRAEVGGGGRGWGGGKALIQTQAAFVWSVTCHLPLGTSTVGFAEGWLASLLLYMPCSFYPFQNWIFMPLEFVFDSKRKKKSCQII